MPKFGILARLPDGRWDTSRVEGIPDSSLVTDGPSNPPSLILRPFRQAGRVVSLCEFSNNAFNHHHGIQSTERFGAGADPGGDGLVHETTRADVTAVIVYQGQERNVIFEFLKSLQVLPERTKPLVVDEQGRPRPGWDARTVGRQS